MKDIKKVNEITKEILGCESEIEMLEYRISEIEKEGSKIYAMLELEIDGNKRGHSRYSLNKGQVLPILKKALEGARARLSAFQKQYEDL